MRFLGRFAAVGLGVSPPDLDALPLQVVHMEGEGLQHSHVLDERNESDASHPAGVLVLRDANLRKTFAHRGRTQITI